ncbi:MAG: WD40 repeat domain-containing protein [Cyanobacteria bacterium P01_F01_bin.3]
MAKETQRGSNRDFRKVAGFTVAAIAGLWIFTAVRYRSNPLALFFRPVREQQSFLNDSIDRRNNARPSISQLRFADDGKVLVGSALTKFYRPESIGQLWQVPSLAPLRRIDDESMWLHDMSVSDDLTWIALAGASPAVQFWDMATGEVKATLSGSDRLMSLPTLSPDGQRLAGYQRLGGRLQVVVHDLKIGKKAILPVDGLSEIVVIAFDPSSQRFAIASETMLQIWTVEQSRLIHTIAIEKPFRARDTAAEKLPALTVQPLTTRLQFSPNGQMLTVWGYRRSQQQISVADGTVVSTSPSLVEQYEVSAMSPDGAFVARLVGTEGRHDLEVVSVASAEVVHRFRGVGALAGLAFSPDGKTIASYEWSGYVALRQLEDESKVDLAHVRAGQGSFRSEWGITYAPDGKTLLVVNGTGAVVLLDAETGNVLDEIATTSFVRFPEMSTDGKTLMAAVVEPTVKLLNSDNASGQTQEKEQAQAPEQTIEPATEQSLVFNQALSQVAVSPDGEFFVVASSEMQLNRVQSADAYQLWIGRTSTNEIVQSIDIDTPVEGFIFSPDNQTFVTVLDSGKDVRLWNAETGRELRRLEGLSVDIVGSQSLSFSADGTVLAMRTEDAARVWQTETGQLLHTFSRNVDADRFDEYLDVAVSSDGRWTAISQNNNVIAIWDNRSGKKVRMVFIDEAVQAIAFSPDDRTLAGTGWGGRVTLWRMPSTFGLF